MAENTPINSTTMGSENRGGSLMTLRKGSQQVHDISQLWNQSF